MALSTNVTIDIKDVDDSFDTKTYEYVLELTKVQNPYSGVKRSRQGALDVELLDPTPANYTDPIKWKTYEVYTEKFCISAFDDTGDEKT